MQESRLGLGLGFSLGLWLVRVRVSLGLWLVRVRLGIYKSGLSQMK